MFFPGNNAFLERKSLWTAMTNHLSVLETEGFSAYRTSGLKPGQSQANWDGRSHLVDGLPVSFPERGAFSNLNFSPSKDFMAVITLYFVLHFTIYSLI